MRRSAFDKLISWTGLVLAALLVVVGGLASWAHFFIEDQVQSQLVSQRITMPEGEAIKSLSDADRTALEPYAGSALDTGAEARAFADHYILAHMNASSEGRSYSAVSTAQREAAAAIADNPEATDAQVAEVEELSALKQSLLDGNTLRGLLLYGYAFATMGTIAGIAAIASFVGAAVMLLLALLGMRHAKRVAATA